jgi:GTP-binding protein
LLKALISLIHTFMTSTSIKTPSKTKPAGAKSLAITPNTQNAANPLQPARFYDTVATEDQLPVDGLPEVAFVGRSNAGKSTAINALTVQHKLAYVSKMPGRTQHLNYFSIPYTARMAQAGMEAPVDAPAMIKLPEAHERSAPYVTTAEKAPCIGYMVDLPGYGYARVGQHMKSHWSGFLTHYITGRQVLAGIVWLMDSRHALTDIDLEFLTLLEGRPLLVLLTKTDKLNQSERALIVNTVRRDLRAAIATNMELPIEHVPQPNVLAFSSLARTGQAQAVAQIASWLNIQTQ